MFARRERFLWHMILHQYYLGCLAHASYLIGEAASSTGIVVDPQRDIDQYLDEAKRHGIEIKHVFLTHFHADFLAGHLELRDKAGAQIHLGARAKAEFEFARAAQGDELQFGDLKLKILETPGHSPESISLLLFDTGKDPNNPHAVLTGDTLFIGDVGRPDLRASLGWTAAELGGMLYDSLHDKLLPLPDETLIYPTHGAGSLCGKQLSEETISTMGVQRRYNYALQPMTREEFIDIVTADQPDAPDYFTYDAVLNTKEHPTLEQSLEANLNALDLPTVQQLQKDGAQILDVRELADYLGAHFPGSLNIGLDGRYATWAGTLLDPGKPIVIIAEPGREVEAQVRLGRIGFDNVAGFLKGGMEALEPHPEFVGRIERIAAPSLVELKAGGDSPFLLDIRTEREWKESHIPESYNIPLNQLASRLRELPGDRRIVVHCASGYRSSTAASILASNQIDVADLIGGVGGWEAAGLLLE